MIPFINIHTHHKPSFSGEWGIRNAYIPQNPAGLDTVKYPVSVGIHPWKISENPQTEMANLALLSAHPAVKAIGECGLDRIISTPIAQQKELLEAQISIANDCGKPLIFHAVKTYSDFPFFLKQLRVPAIFHGYEGNLRQTEMLMQYPVFFSFGKNLLTPSPKIISVIKYLPWSRIFVETDTQPMSIIVCYKKLSFLKEESIERAQMLLYQNAQKLFSIP